MDIFPQELRNHFKTGLEVQKNELAQILKRKQARSHSKRKLYMRSKGCVCVHVHSHPPGLLLRP